MTRHPADLMREWRRIAGLSTTEAGAELGLSSRTIEDIEQGRTRVDDILTRYGLEALIARARQHRWQDEGIKSAAPAAVRERKKKRGKRKISA